MRHATVEEPGAQATRPSYDDLVRLIESTAQSFHDLGTVLTAFGAISSGDGARRVERSLREAVARARR